MFSCRKAAQIMSRELDAPLSFGQRVSLKGHLWMCSACRLARRQMQWVHKVVGGMSLEDAQKLLAAVPENLSPEAAAQIKAKLTGTDSPNI